MTDKGHLDPTNSISKEDVVKCLNDIKAEISKPFLFYILFTSALATAMLY